MGVEASIIVKFGDDSEDGIVIVEIDDQHEANLDYDGNLKTNFSPTDKPVLIIHHEPDVIITDILCTDGKVSNIKLSTTNLLRSRSDDYVFVEKWSSSDLVVNSQSFNYYDAIKDDIIWYGNTGEVYIVSAYDNRLETGATVELSDGEIPCACTLTYTVEFQEQFQLTPPPLELAEDETYTIHVVIYAKKVTEV